MYAVWFGLEKSIQKKLPIQMAFTKEHPNTSNKILFCTIFSNCFDLDRFEFEHT